MNIKKALTIGGSDPSGGAGIQADMNTLYEHGVYPYTAISAVTAQNSMGVLSYELVSAKTLRDQIEAVLADGEIKAIKTGMLGSSENIMEVVTLLHDYNVGLSVVDPVIRATDNKMLISGAAIAVFKKRLLPHCFMITPNISEAARLTGIQINSANDILEAAKALKEMGAAWVLIKGGHLKSDMAIDFLFDGKNHYVFEAKRIKQENVRGTGCMLASAICAGLVNGLDPYQAVNAAKTYVYEKIKSAVQLGKGSLQAVRFNLNRSEGGKGEDRIN